jgi:hypothetical protein
MGDFDNDFHQALTHALAQGDLKSEEILVAVEKALHTLISDTAAFMIKGLKRSAPKALRGHRRFDAGFVARNKKRWKRPLDLLEMLWLVTEEVGSKFNATERPNAIATKNYQFEALVSLHARALLVTREVICLLEGGFPDGALARWRSLHEIAVTAAFIQRNEQEIANRYLASFPFAAYRAAVLGNEHAERAGLDPFTDDELAQMRAQCEALEQRFGTEMRHDYGWAAPALNIQKPIFAQIEEAVELKHWRPRFRWASQHTHSPYRPPHALLGTADVTLPLHLVGQSNSGFTDPLHMTAISLNQATSSLLITRPDIDTIVFLRVIHDLAEEVGKAALAVDRIPPPRASGRKRKGSVKSRVAPEKTKKTALGIERKKSPPHSPAARRDR